MLTPMVGIPLACAVAVLKYRLYDLDVVVKKTVVAGLVAAAFTVIYALVVAGAGAVTGHPGSSALTFAAAALAAVALQPVRARAGLLADRLVYGRRASPYEVLSEFAGRIAGTYSTEEVLPPMARMLTEATGARAGGGVAAQRRGRAPGGGLAGRGRNYGPPPGTVAAAGPMAAPGLLRWSTAVSGWARCGSPARP